MELAAAFAASLAALWRSSLYEVVSSIQWNRSRPGGGVRIVGAADAPDRLPISSIIVDMVEMNCKRIGQSTGSL